MIYTNSRIANFLATERPDSAAWVLATQIVEFGPVPDYGGPPPIASSTPGYEVRDLDEAALPLPSEQELEAWEEPAPEPNPVTDVEALFLRVQAKLNGDEEKRTGKAVDPKGAVPTARAMAATTMLYLAWSYPSKADLETEFNQCLLTKIYEDPTTNTTAESSVAQKRSALHFTLVMLAGRSFGVDYQAELGAYERTASGDFQEKLALDNSRDWLALTCPVMNKPWPAFDSLREMFQCVMK